MRGRVIAGNDADYDQARKVFNAMIDRRPAVIARCVGAADVIACVRFARDHDLVVSVRSGGHGVAGMAVCDDGLVIDLSQMKTVRIDPKDRIAQSDPGVTLKEFDHETQAFGLATTLGASATIRFPFSQLFGEATISFPTPRSRRRGNARQLDSLA